MVFAVVAALFAIGGIVYGALRRRLVVLIGSAVVLVLVVATWAYFWFNPY